MRSAAAIFASRPKGARWAAVSASKVAASTPGRLSPSSAGDHIPVQQRCGSTRRALLTSGFLSFVTDSNRDFDGTREAWHGSQKQFCRRSVQWVSGAALTGAVCCVCLSWGSRASGERKEDTALRCVSHVRSQKVPDHRSRSREHLRGFGLAGRGERLSHLAVASCSEPGSGNKAKASSSDRSRILYSWGCGIDGQLGLGGSALSVSTPQPVPASALHDGEFILQCAAGAFHSVCCTSLGRVFTWGRGGKNRLGHEWPRETPASASPGGRPYRSSTKHLSASGIAETAVQTLPKCVEGLCRLSARVDAVACGEDHTLVLTDSGEVYSWGGNAHGECGRVETSESAEAVQAGDPARTKRRSWLWGVLRGDKGEGDIDALATEEASSAHDANSPWAGRTEKEKGLVGGRVEGALRGKRVTQIACGKHVSAAVTEEGELYVWGEGRGGQVGPPVPAGRRSEDRRKEVSTSTFPSSGLSFNVPTPRRLEVYGLAESEETSQDRTPKKVVQVACGSSHCAALTEDGEIYTWGSDDYGQLGLGKESRFVLLPRRVDALADKRVVSVRCGHFFTCCTTSTGEVFVWGYGRDGECGNGRSDAALPVLISLEAQPGGKKHAGGTVLDTVAGGGHLAARTQEGGLWMWGRGREGQLGRGDAIESVAASRDSPQLVEELWNRSPRGSQSRPSSDSRALTGLNDREEARQTSRVVAAWCGQSHTLALVESTGKTDFTE
ncbi:regulator of chromosome condensation (RCC1) repeat-containing protein [Toxoplasma gondii VAND]|uniref:Regulator of chromosome condensation (RCC1) repeat-containing protein n=1 Tax=Toxoplasma gondii VAND TaxID=933077 RepID=A0A086QHI2_TOXGO|nr:regulator of chromosome condensation (RCC1) repeat-containing protein [Toxoplasma gondii VAND]